MTTIAFHRAKATTLVLETHQNSVSHMPQKDAVSFTAEVKEVKSSKTASLDMVYRLVLISDDPTVNSLGLLSADSLVNVTVEVVNG